MQRVRLPVLLALLMILLVFLQYRLWFEADGIRDMLRLKNKLASQRAENEKLKKHNEALLFQIRRLQQGEEAIESRARSELGMIKKGEKFYRMVK